MFRTLIIFGLLVASSWAHLAPIAARLPLPGPFAAPGSPWPRPAEHLNSSEYATLPSRFLSFQSSAPGCEILNRAFQRYGDGSLLFRDLLLTPAEGKPLLTLVRVEIPTSPGENLCDEYPSLYTAEDRKYEAYNISVARREEDESAVATISAHTVWGALHGIETFSQLIWRDEGVRGAHHFYVNFTEIRDFPRFPHRGFMLDTARHWVDLPIIRSVIDGLAYNRMNVFHWHVTDDQSFPLVTRTFPELSAKGAYLPELVYEPEEVQGIIEYARDRGVRVVLELDTPGHTLSWGNAFPELLTPCYDENGENPGTSIPGKHAAYEILDPTKNFTFSFLEELFREVETVTVDRHVHLGMDEIYSACWDSSPVVQEFIRDNNLTDAKGLQGYYVDKLVDIVKGLGLKPIIWHDPLEYEVQPDMDVLIQVWKGGNSSGAPSDAWIPYLRESLRMGYKTILSSCWYLNYISYGGADSREFRKYYECDPIRQLRPNITEAEEKLVLGGEAAYWGEYADGTSFLPRIFPLVGTTAERLWSPEFDISNDTTNAAWHRLDQHRCRMLWRGIAAQPIFNGYCFPEEKSGPRKGDEGLKGGAASVQFLRVLSLTSLMSFTLAWL